MYLTPQEFITRAKRLIRVEGALVEERVKQALSRAEARLHMLLAPRYVVPFNLVALAPVAQEIIKRLVFYIAIEEIARLWLDRTGEEAVTVPEMDDELTLIISGKADIPSVPRKQQVFVVDRELE